MAYDYDEDDHLRMMRRQEIDRQNQENQGMAGRVPPNPYGGASEKKGGWTGILSPAMKLGGTAATMLGQPEIGIPLSVAGGAVGGYGSGGGLSGAAMGAGKSAIGQGMSAEMGSGLDWLKAPVDDTISVGGLTIPGGRTSPIDLESKGLTVPASPRTIGGS